MLDPMDSEKQTLINLRAWVERAQFSPFEIVTTSGASFVIPTTDHITVPHFGATVIVYNDEGIAAFIQAAQISHIKTQTNAA